ncbi:MAG TPA: RNA polymerase-binding protein RbpA [Actinomycetaceae bacterium]|nr:RNA polymerase-binding protein RbpA [Actinomycetaceae bacterium]
MAERALRGMTIGAKSMESEENIEYAPRFLVDYDCPNGHVVTLPFSVDAEIPAIWGCDQCGEEAVRRNHEKPEPEKPVKKPRTHWDMLLERRTIEDLEELLNERLELLRSGRLHADRMRRRSA